MTEFDLNALQQQILSTIPAESLKQWAEENRLISYQKDPVAFGEKELGESYTEDIKRMMESVRDYPITIAQSGNATGKCVGYDEEIFNSDGIPFVASSLIGQRILVNSVDSCLRLSKEYAYFSDNGEKEVIEIVTERGRVIKRTENHPLVVGKIRKISSHNARRLVSDPEWKQAKDIVAGDYILSVSKFDNQNTKCLFSDEQIRIIAYLIGNGHLGLNSVRFSQEENENLDEFRQDVEKIGCSLIRNGEYDYRIVSPFVGNQHGRKNPINKLIDDLGLFNKRSNEKWIPKEIYNLPDDKLAMFINRLYSTDGWVSFKNNGKKGIAIQLGFCSVSKQLCYDLQSLLLRFGIVSNIHKKRTTWTHKGIEKVGEAYHLCIHDAPSFLSFREKIGIYGPKAKKLDEVAEICFSRKKIHKYKTLGSPEGFKWEKVRSVRKAGVLKTVAVTVPGNKTFLTHYVEHNTHSAATIALWFYKCFPDSQIYTAAAPPEENLSILWSEIAKKVNNSPKLFATDTVATLNIRRNAWSFIKGVTIPIQGSSEERVSKFCTDAEEFFELTSGEIVTYKSLIGRKIKVVSVDKFFNKNISDAEFFDNGVQNVYEIELSSGQKYLRTEEHPLFIGKIAQSRKKLHRIHEEGRYVVFEEGWRPIKDIKEGDAVLVPENTSFNFGNLDIDPNEAMVLGYLIGDGCIKDKSRILFFQEDNKQLADFKEVVSSMGAHVEEYNLEEYAWKVVGNKKKGGNPVRNALVRNGLMGTDSFTKFVPDSINKAKREYVALFLNRLYSTDGWACVCSCGSTYRKAEIGYGTSSERLAKDVQRLLYRFGISSKVVRRKTSWAHKGVKKTTHSYVCNIWRAADIIRFAEQIGIYGKEEAVNECLEYAKTRKSYASWRKSIYEGFAWDKVKSVKLIGQKSTVGVCVPGDHTYLTTLVEHNSGKHAPYLLFILDEGDAIPDEVYQGIETCLSGGILFRLLVMFNPKRMSGKAYRMIKDKTANVIHLTAFTHPNVVTGQNLIPGAVTREKTIQRINSMTIPIGANEHPSSDCFEVPDFLVGTTCLDNMNRYYPPLPAGWRKVINNEFYYLTLGKYPAQGEHQLIPQEWIDAARVRWNQYVATWGENFPENTKPICGLDVADEGLDRNIFTARVGGFVKRQKEWRGVDPLVTTDRAAEIALDENAAAVNVDSGGVGASVAPGLRIKHVRANRIMFNSKPTEKVKGKDKKAHFRCMRDQLWWECREWLRTSPNDLTGAMLPPDDELLEELSTPTYEEKDDQIRVMDKDRMKKALGGRSPDKSSSLILTFAPKEGRPRVRMIDPSIMEVGKNLRKEESNNRWLEPK
jgi:intein/homing endonuclease